RAADGGAPGAPGAARASPVGVRLHQPPGRDGAAATHGSVRPGSLSRPAARVHRRNGVIMQVTHAQLVGLLRGLHARGGGTSAVLNLLRAGEVRGGSEVLVLSELVTDPQMRLDFARHAMDESRHAFLLLRRMQELGFNLPRVPHALDRLETLSERSRARDFRQVYADRGPAGGVQGMEFITMALIEHHDAWRKMRAH